MPLSPPGSVFSLWVVAVMACYLDWCPRLQDFCLCMCERVLVAPEIIYIFVSGALLNSLFWFHD